MKTRGALCPVRCFKLFSDIKGRREARLLKNRVLDEQGEWGEDMFGPTARWPEAQ